MHPVLVALSVNLKCSFLIPVHKEALVLPCAQAAGTSIYSRFKISAAITGPGMRTVRKPQQSTSHSLKIWHGTHATIKMISLTEALHHTIPADECNKKSISTLHSITSVHISALHHISTPHSIKRTYRPIQSAATCLGNNNSFISVKNEHA